MPSLSTPLSNYPVLYSRDPELVRDRLFTVFGATSFDIPASQSNFAARANYLGSGGIGLSYCDYASDVSLGFGEATFVRQIFNISGTGRYEAGGPPGEIAPGSWSSVLPAHTPVKLDFKSGYRQLILRVESDSLARNLSALLGQEITRKLEFENAFDAPAMTSLKRRVFSLRPNSMSAASISPISPQPRSNA
jgi:hypothetical protein